MYATVGFVAEDLPVRISVSRRRQGKSPLLHVTIESHDFTVLLDEATARNLHDALDGALAGIPAADPGATS